MNMPMPDNDPRGQYILPVVPKVNPLTPEDKDTLIRILKENETHIDLIGRCEQCGIPVDEKKERAALHGNLAKMILQQFFPTTVMPDQIG